MHRDLGPADAPQRRNVLADSVARFDRTRLGQLRQERQAGAKTTRTRTSRSLK